jgi:transcriptional regulator with XRE-family HTH domain
MACAIVRRRGAGARRFTRERGTYVHVDDGKHFGNRLREARVTAGLSQSELEELSGIPKARLSRYENGHVEPSIQTLARLARALNVSEASLLGDQRAVLEDFFQVLHDRGVRIATTEQGGRLAQAVADMIEALGGIESIAGPDAGPESTSWISIPEPAESLS